MNMIQGKFRFLLSVMCIVICLLSACSPSPHKPAVIHEIVFDANGGHWNDGKTSVTIEAEENSPIWDFRPDVPARNGYHFTGWFTDRNGVNAYDPNTPVTGPLTLYAGWVRNSSPVYRVEFDTEGGSAIAPQLVISGHTIERPQKNPERNGFSFEGWSLTENGDPFDFSTPVRGNMTLHALWKEAKTITFVFDLPVLGEEAVLSPVPEKTAVADGTVMTDVPEVSLSYNGTEFTFLGWFEEGSSTRFDFSEKITRNMTLHARWEDVATTGSECITYNEDGLRKWAEEHSSDSCTIIADISLTSPWTPVGSEETPYNGMFRGNGHTISGLRVTGNEDHSGLFKVIGGSGSVSDLIITGAEISGSGYDGIVAGENLGTISSVTVSGTVSESGIAGGGIAGRNRGTIMSCSSSASAKGNGDVGGITGVNYGTVKDCTASGTLSGEYTIGGIAGLNTDGAVISSCSFTGKVTDGYYAGGIAGCNDVKSRIEKSSFSGTVEDPDWYIGGIAGLNSQESEILECTSSGSISGRDEAGGITGYNFLGSVYACSFSGHISSNTIVGGIAGLNMGPLAACYSTGTVEGNEQVGGIAGINRFYELISCYSAGKVTGKNMAGNIAGRNERASIISSVYQSDTLQGVGEDMSSAGAVEIHQIGTEYTWDDAMNDMNSALSGIPYKYERNTDGDTFPLKAVMR